MSVFKDQTNYLVYIRRTFGDKHKYTLEHRCASRITAQRLAEDLERAGKKVAVAQENIKIYTVYSSFVEAEES